MRPLNMIKARGDGVTIQLAEWPGEGRPILCVHGLTANCRSFDVLAAGLAPRHRVLAMDLRGRGLSEMPEKGYSIDYHCRDIDAVLDDLGLDKIVLLGHSLGAFITLTFAATRPDRTAAIVLADGGAQLSPEEWAKVAVAIKPSTDRIGQEFPSFEDYIAPFKQAPFLQPWSQAVEDYFRYESEEVDGLYRSRIKPATIAEESANIVSFDPKVYYPDVKCPVLVIRATVGLAAADDLVMPEAAVAGLVEVMPQAKVVSLEGANHYSMVLQDFPKRDEAIINFLDELEG